MMNKVDLDNLPCKIVLGFNRTGFMEVGVLEEQDGKVSLYGIYSQNKGKVLISEVVAYMEYHLVKQTAIKFISKNNL